MKRRVDQIGSYREPAQVRVRYGYLIEEHLLVANQKRKRVDLAGTGPLYPVDIDVRSVSNEQDSFRINVGGTAKPISLRPFYRDRRLFLYPKINLQGKYRRKENEHEKTYKLLRSTY